MPFLCGSFSLLPLRSLSLLRSTTRSTRRGKFNKAQLQCSQDKHAHQKPDSPRLRDLPFRPCVADSSRPRTHTHCLLSPRCSAAANVSAAGCIRKESSNAIALHLMQSQMRHPTVPLSSTVGAKADSAAATARWRVRRVETARAVRCQEGIRQHGSRRLGLQHHLPGRQGLFCNKVTPHSIFTANIEHQTTLPAGIASISTRQLLSWILRSRNAGPALLRHPVASPVSVSM